MILPETPTKIKHLGKILLEGGLFMTVFGLMFLLGRISALSAHTDPEPIEVIYPPLVSHNIPLYQEGKDSGEPEHWSFAASKTGKTYYPKGCAGLSRIKPENRVYFSTEAEAKTAGLNRSASCE
jgi:hypothetical protein